jgi:hypothetical protein
MAAEIELHIQQLNTDALLKHDQQFRLHLKHLIDELIENDFSRLVQVLYRIDISETKLKDLLRKNTETDASIMIADLIIERQIQKIEARNQSLLKEDTSDEEIW